jgi:hypothetical protein
MRKIMAHHHTKFAEKSHDRQAASMATPRIA